MNPHSLMLCIATTLVVANAAGADQITIEGQGKIQDGDTLSIGPIMIRLNGIDAPEEGQICDGAGGQTFPCGKQATGFLAGLIANGPVLCIPLERDAYGRLVSECSVAGRDLSQALVDQGLAWAYRTYSDAYISAEDAAKAAGVGIWAADNQPPWEYRANKWERAAEAAPRRGCPIKGNISQNGEHIYHTPWSPWYDSTRITEAKGERWFCDEAEAQAAGWRAARGR